MLAYGTVGSGGDGSGLAIISLAVSSSVVIAWTTGN